MQEAPFSREPALPWPGPATRLDTQALGAVAAALFYAAHDLLARLDTQALGAVAAALFYAAHDLLALELTEWRPRAVQMLEAAQACSEALEHRLNQDRARH